MLEVRIRSQVGAFALDVDFRSERETGVLAVAGVSGVGKTTLLRCIAGLQRPTEGRIALGERVLFDAAGGIDLPVHQRRVGVVFQDSRLFPHLSVRQNLRYGRPSHMEKTVDFDRVVRLLGIESVLDRRPRALSGGEQQRVAIGRALLGGPELLLMDEPLASLDAARKRELLPFLAELPAHFSLPVLYVSHDLDVVLQLADELVVLEDGRVAAQGAVTEAANAFIGHQVGDTVVEGTVVETPAGLRVRVAAALDWMVLGLHAGSLGQRVRMRVPADDVLLAAGTVPSMSVRNRMAASVVAIRSTDRGQVVSLALRDAPDVSMRARVSAEAVAELGLQVGTAVTALVKAASVRIPAGMVQPTGWGDRPADPADR